ncbi:unnamed protein product [Rhizophagus irregularis]|nr:unnamed protein product [Rhizophagus irregularis]
MLLLKTDTKLWLVLEARSQFLCSSSQKCSCFEQNLSEEDYLSECKESKSVSLSFGSLVLYARKGFSLCGSSQFQFLWKGRFSVLDSLRLFVKGRYSVLCSFLWVGNGFQFLLLFAKRYSILCEQENFITQNNLGKIEIKGSFKADDVSVEK